MLLRKLLAFALVVTGVGVYLWLEVAPSLRRARGTVAQIAFVQGRIALRNGRNDLFASDDNGRSWRKLPDRVPTLAVANGHELWGAHGWPGIHERASAQIWRSLDLGETWSTAKLDLP